MGAENILRSYGDTNAKEDVVLNAIEILTAEENQIFNMLGKTTAINTVHIYQTDTLDTAASNAVGEAEDYTAKALTTPSKLQNLVTNEAYPFKVSRTQQKISHYSGEDELTRQTTKALKNWGNSAEFDLVRSTLVSGVSGTAPKLAGIIVGISNGTNYTAHNSGTVFSATILNGLMTLNWESSNGDVATDLFMGSALKQIADGFAQKSTTYVQGEQTKVVNMTTVYETGAGTLRFHMHRYVQQSSDTTARILAINPEKLKVAFLEKPYIDKELARSGDYDVRAVVGKFTLEVRNKSSNWFAYGFKKTV